MTRIIPADGKTKGLTQVSDTLQIAREFTDRGLNNLPEITMQLNREEYQYWQLIEEFYSDALKCRMKVWNIDGEVTAISERLERYTIDDVKQVSLFCDVFGGEIVPGRRKDK